MTDEEIMKNFRNILDLIESLKEINSITDKIRRLELCLGMLITSIFTILIVKLT